MASKAEAELLKNAWREERAAREQDRQARAAREADLKASGPMDSGFVENDGDLYPILAWAKGDELHLLATILSQKVSSRIDEGCRSPLAIASEIQRMGGNSVVNLFRGHGVGYQEIVLDAAEKIPPVNFPVMALVRSTSQVIDHNLIH